MIRRIALAVPALLIVVGCAGPAKLTQRSQEKLAGGDAWKAWQLATRALDKQPGNPAARDAATAAGAAIAQDWERRIHALADVDTLQAAEQVLAFTDFRANAARYATIPVGASWPQDERALRLAAARTYYQRGAEAMATRRPKKAWADFHDAEVYMAGYRDAAKRADRAMELGLTRVAILPLRASGDLGPMGAQVAQDWRDDLAQHFAPGARFTRILGGDAVDGVMTVSQLAGISREDAIRLGRRIGAQRIVWGSIGGLKSQTHLDFFRDAVARRIVERDGDGHETERWIEIPIEVVARVRDVTVGVDYELISTADGSAVAHQSFDRSTSARVVWTSYQPEGDLAAYSLVSTTVRSANPDRARQVETRWKAVCGDNTTLQQVLEARRSSRDDGHYRRSALPRLVSGAAFLFLTDLPPADDLAYAALARGCGPLRDDLVRLDGVDDADLGASITSSDSR